MLAKRIILSPKKLYFNFWKNLNETYNSDCSFLLYLAEIHLLDDCQSVIVEEFTEFVTTWSRWFTVVSTANVHVDLLCESLECLPLMNIQGWHLARLGRMRKTTTVILSLSAVILSANTSKCQITTYIKIWRHNPDILLKKICKSYLENITVQTAKD